jgi:tetratricopeptide (TPR) repeat protein
LLTPLAFHIFVQEIIKKLSIYSNWSNDVKNLTKLVLILIVGSFLFQSFQCATPEMSSAKLAMQDEDWDKAIKNLNKEVANKPGHAAAWLSLSQCYYYQAKDNGTNLMGYKKAYEALNETNKLKLKPKEVEDKTKIEYNIWIGTINKGIGFIRKYDTTKIKDKKLIDSSIISLELAKKLRPKHESNSKFLAMAYAKIKNKDKTIQEYEDYAMLMKKSLEFGKEKGLFLKKDRIEALKGIGIPKQTFDIKKDSSQLIDLYSINDKLFTLYTKKLKDGKDLKVVGWRFDPPEYWLFDEKTLFTTIDVQPFSSLAYEYYIKGNLDKSIENYKRILQLDPSNENANKFLIVVLKDANRSEEADQMLLDMIKKNPDVAEFRVQYGDVLFYQDKFDDAIKEYKVALKLDPTFAGASRNMASAYKNKALTIQKAEIEKQNADPKYVLKTDKYLPFIEESVKAFEDCLKSDDFRNDYKVYVDLWNNYYALEQKDKAEQTLGKLESLESRIKDKDKKDYWEQMTKLYDQLRDPKYDTKYDEAVKNYNKYSK